MGFAVHMSDIAEIGGTNVFFLHSAPQIYSLVVIRRIWLQSGTSAVLEGNLMQFSFTSRVFFFTNVLVPYGSVLSKTYLLSE